MARSATSGFLYVGGSQLLMLVISIVFTPVLVRILGPSVYGTYAVTLSVFAFANFILTSGTNDAIRKFISERDDCEWKRRVFGAIAELAIILTILVSAILILGAASGVVASVFGPEYTPLFFLLGVLAVGRQAREFLTRTLMGLHLESRSEPIKVLQKILFSVGAIIVAYLGYGVAGILIVDIATSFLIAAFALVYVSRNIDLSRIGGGVDVPRGSMYRYTASTIIFFGLMMSLYHADVLILQQYVSGSKVGYYKGALVIAETLWFVPAAIQLTLLQRVSTLWADKEMNEIQKIASVTTRFSAAFTLLASIGMAALSEPFVTIYLGEDFRPSVAPLVFLLPGVIGFSAARPTIAINQARRTLRPLILATAFCSAINILLNLILIPKFGIIGAAIATSVAYASLIVFQSTAAIASGYNPLSDIRVGRMLATAVTTAIPVFGLAESLPNLLALGIVPPLGFSIFCICAILFGLVDSEELAAIFAETPFDHTRVHSIVDKIPRL